MPNSLCNIRKTALLELSEIATCFVFTVLWALYTGKPFFFCLTVVYFYHKFFVHFLFILSMAELSHSSCVNFKQDLCFEVNTPLCCFLLNNLWPILVVMLCGLANIFGWFSFHFLIGTVPFFLCNCYTRFL